MSGTDASGSRFGPVDLYLLGLPEGVLDRAALSALIDGMATLTTATLHPAGHHADPDAAAPHGDRHGQGVAR